MINDIFQRRYQELLNFDRLCAEQIIGPTLVQARFIFFEDIQPKLSRDFGETFFREINQMLARELGRQSLKQLPFAAINELNICSSFLATPFQPSNSEWFGDPDHYCKTRLSMLELLFRTAEKHVRRHYVVGSPVVGNALDTTKLIAMAAMNGGIQELNARLQANRTGLVYDNGFLHLATDKLSAERIAKPFWEIVSDPKWKIVDQEMKEAIDRLEHGQHDAFTHATKALESTIKIISNEKGWSTGHERGAANYIDNLQSQRAGRFIDAWEAKALTSLFQHIRNPYVHGGGSNPPPPLSDVVQTWAIESCMSWIKNLVRRTP